MGEFADFLHAEMKRRDIASMREFARWIGLSHGAVWQVMENGREPGLPFILAAHKATGIGVAELIEMARPGALHSTGPSLSSRILAQQLDQLSDDDQAIARGFVNDRLGESAKKGDHRR